MNVSNAKWFTPRPARCSVQTVVRGLRLGYVADWPVGGAPARDQRPPREEVTFVDDEDAERAREIVENLLNLMDVEVEVEIYNPSSDPNANVSIVGTTNPSHMATNVRQIDNDLPIPDSVIAELNRRFEQLDKDWAQRT